MKRKPTKDQQRALLNIYQRDELGISFLKFRRTAYWAFGDVLMVAWAGMTLGIEHDGYIHS